MTTPFDRWTPRIADARDEDTRQALLAEVGAWRALNLTDMRAQRDAAFAMARIHMLMDDRASALREAQALVSLCQTPPEASGEELEAAAPAGLSEMLAAVYTTPADLHERLERQVAQRLDSLVMLDVVTDLFGAGLETSRLLMTEEVPDE